MADSTADKARKARNRAEETNKYAGGTTYETRKLVRKNSRGGKDITVGDKIGGLYLTKTEERAAKLMQTRRINDTGRTSRRADFIAGPKSPVSKARKAAAMIKANTGISTGTPKKQTPKASAVAKAAKVVKKAMVDPTSALPKTAKSKASKSVTGEKAAEEMRKRTSPRGVRKYEKGASKAIDKKYPGLYKKSKGMK